MSTIFSGRYTAQTNESFAVFLIGMRINHLWMIHKWLPVFNAMGPMIATLMRHPEKGLLHTAFYFGPRGPLLIQYWRSAEELERFAREPSEPHLGAWKRFNQAVGKSGAVGIWHETYIMEPGKWEVVYGNMPKFGLGAAMEHAPVGPRTESAHQRRERK
jgi:hypothetical protein